MKAAEALPRLLTVQGATLDLTTSAGPAPTRPWGLAPEGEWLDEPGWETVTGTHVGKDPQTGSRTLHAYAFRRWLPERWHAHVGFTGDGALTYLGDGRFRYRAPEGRVLVLERLAGECLIDGRPFQGTAWVGDELELVIDPGAALVGYTCEK